MHVDTWAVVFATLLGPVFAVQAQKWIERGHAKTARKQRIFRALMINRETPLADDVVGALNAVPLDFEKGKASDEPVLEAWRSYLLHLRKPSSTEVWGNEQRKRLLDLLEAMAKHLRTEFPRSELEGGGYVPDYYWSRWTELEAIRKLALAVLNGNKALVVDNAGANTNEGKHFAKKLTEVVEGKQALTVTLAEKQPGGPPGW